MGAEVHADHADQVARERPHAISGTNDKPDKVTGMRAMTDDGRRDMETRPAFPPTLHAPPAPDTCTPVLYRTGLVSKRAGDPSAVQA